MLRTKGLIKANSAPGGMATSQGGQGINQTQMAGNRAAIPVGQNMNQPPPPPPVQPVQPVQPQAPPAPAQPQAPPVDQQLQSQVLQRMLSSFRANKSMTEGDKVNLIKNFVERFNWFDAESEKFVNDYEVKTLTAMEESISHFLEEDTKEDFLLSISKEYIEFLMDTSTIPEEELHKLSTEFAMKIISTCKFPDVVSSVTSMALKFDLDLMQAGHIDLFKDILTQEIKTETDEDKEIAEMASKHGMTSNQFLPIMIKASKEGISVEDYLEKIKNA